MTVGSKMEKGAVHRLLRGSVAHCGPRRAVARATGVAAVDLVAVNGAKFGLLPRQPTLEGCRHG
jgi:hypothetical protein